MAVILVVSAHDALLEQLAGDLEAGGHAVARAPSGQAALAAAHRSRHDAILVDAGLPDMDAADLCRLLRQEPHVTPHTAIFLAGGPASRDARLAALGAGASDVLGQPLDAAELVLKVEHCTKLKAAAERLHLTSLVDPETGLYNLPGLARHIEELGALSVRTHASLACVVLAPEVEEDEAVPEVAAFCAQAIKTGVRHSDVSGRIAPVEFAVVAPRTNANGAIRLTQRLAGVMRRRSQEAAGIVPSFKLRAGYDAVGNVAYAPITARDLLTRARRASLDTGADSRLGWIRSYEGQSAS
jgi:PleD family two-component response regulator